MLNLYSICLLIKEWRISFSISKVFGEIFQKLLNNYITQIVCAIKLTLQHDKWLGKHVLTQRIKVILDHFQKTHFILQRDALASNIVTVLKCVLYMYMYVL